MSGREPPGTPAVPMPASTDSSTTMIWLERGRWMP